MAADRPEGSNLEQSIAKRVGNRLRRMFGMENLHDGSREQFEEVHESIPEGGRPLQADTTTGRTGTASSLPDAGLSRPWSSDFEPFPTPGAGGGQSQGISGGGGGGSAGTGVEAEGLAGVAGANGGAAHTTPSGGSGPGHATASGGSGGTGGGGGAHNGPNGGTASPLSNASTGLKGETHRPITDDDERVTGDEDKPIQGTVIEHPISSEGKLLVLKSFSIEGFPATHTPGTKPVSIPGIGSFLVDPLGNYTFTPAPNWHGQVPTIHYTVTDGYSTNNSALNINIKPVDDSFTDNSEKFVYDEDSGQHSGNLLKGSSSPDGTLSIKSFSVDGQQGTLDQPFVIQGKGTLTIHQDGTFEFQSAPNYNGPIPQATYTVTDGSGNDVQSTLNINIKPVDDSFTDNSETFVYDEDSGQHSGNLLKGSSSPDGSLSIKSFSLDGQQGTLDQPFVIQGKGTLTIHQDGTFEFQSAPNYNGPIPQATYTVTDGSGNDVQSTLNINIKPVDDSFTDNSEKFVYDEDSGQHSGNLLKGSSSPDGSLSIKSFSLDGQQGTLDQPFVIQGKGTLTIHQDGTFEFQSAPNYNGPIPQATYTVTDGSGNDVQSTLNINIKPVDDSFTDNSEKFVYDEDSGQHSGNLLKGSSSPDGSLSIKSFSLDGQQGTLDQPFVIQGKGTLTIHQDGTFEFQSAPNYNGPIPQATYTVTDGSGNDVQSTLNINIKPVDDSFTDNSEKFVYDEDSGQHSGNLLKGSSSPDGSLSIKSFSLDGQQGTLDQPFVIQGKGTLTIHQDGTFEFQSAPNYNGPIPQATYTVTDGSGNDVQSTLNINIKPVDDSFTDNSEKFVYDEDSGQHSGNLLKGSSSPDGSLSIKSFSLDGQQGTLDQPFVIQGKGTLTIHQDGTFEFQSAPNYNGPFPQATYTVTDGSGKDVQSTLNINIKPVDDSFTDNSEKFVYDEDSGQHSGNLLKGSSSPDGTLSIKSFSVDGQQGTLDQPFVIQGKGTLTIHQDGTFEFQSAPNYNGPFPQATYTVTDGSGKDVQSTLNINIKPVDDSFTDNSEKFVYDEDSGQHSGNLLKGSSSPDGTLSIKSFSVDGQQGTLDQPFVIQGKGTLTIHQDGTFEFQSAPNYNGPFPQATYTVTDGSGKDVQSTLNINIKPVDDSFTDNSEKFVYDEDSGQHSGNLLKGSSSPDGTLSIKSFSVDGQQGTLDQPFVIQGKGTLTIHQDGTFEFQSAPNYNGPFPQATYTVTDGSGKDVQSTLNINIKPVDDSFTDNSEKFVYDEDSGQHSGNLLKGSSSPDGTLSIKSFSVDGQQGTLDQPFVIQGKGTLTIHQDGTFEFQSAPNYNGPFPQATYTVTDGSGKDVQSTLNINIKPVDDSFTDNSEKFVYDEDSGQHSGNLLKGSSSPDGTLSIKSFSVDGQQGTLDQPFVIQGKGTLTIHQDGTFEFQSAPNYNGPFPQATYTVTDGSGKDVQSTLNINIKPVDDSFTDNSEKFVYDEDSGQHSGNLLKGSSSPDGTLSIKSFSVDGQQGTLDQPFVIQGKGTLTIHQDGTFEFQSAPNYNGPFPQATYTVTDGSGKDVQSTLNINIKPVDDNPDAINDNFITDEDTTSSPLTLLSNDTDPEGNTLSITSINNVQLTPGNPQSISVPHGTVDIDAKGTITFTPDQNFNGSVSFPYTISDGHGGTDTAVVQGTVNAVNDNPDAINDNFVTDEDTTSSPLTLLSNDTDPEGNTLSITSINNVQLTPGNPQSISVPHGTVDIDTKGTITFTPDQNFNGSVSFPYTISDGHGGTDTAIVQGTVNAAPPSYTKPPDPTQPGGELHLTGGPGIPAAGGTVGSHHFGGNNSPGQWTIVPITQERSTGSATAAGMFGTAHIDGTGTVGYDLNSQSALQHLLTPPSSKGAGSQLTAAQLGGLDLLHKLGHPKTSITLQTNSFTDVFAIYKDGNFIGFWVASWNQNIQAYRHDMGHPPQYSGGITDFKSWDLGPSAYPDYHPAPPPHGSTRMGQVHQRDAEISDFSDELNAQITALEAAGIHLTEKAEVKEFLGTTMLIVHTDHGDIVQSITNYADTSPLRTIDPSGLDEVAQKALSDAGHPSTSSEDATNNNPGITQEPLPADDANRELLDGLHNLGLLDSSNSTETGQRTQEDGSLITTLTTHTNHGDIVQTITAAGNGEQAILKVDTSRLDPETQQALQDSLKSSQEAGTSQNKLANGQVGTEESKPEPITIDGAALTSAIQEIQKLDPAALAAMQSGHIPDETNEQIDASTPTPLDTNEVPISSSKDVFSEEINTKRPDLSETAPPENDQDLTTGGELLSDTQQDESLFNL